MLFQYKKKSHQNYSTEIDQTNNNNKNKAVDIHQPLCIFYTGSLLIRVGKHPTCPPLQVTPLTTTVGCRLGRISNLFIRVAKSKQTYHRILSIIFLRIRIKLINFTRAVKKLCETNKIQKTIIMAMSYWRTERGG